MADNSSSSVATKSSSSSVATFSSSSSTSSVATFSSSSSTSSVATFSSSSSSSVATKSSSSSSSSSVATFSSSSSSSVATKSSSSNFGALDAPQNLAIQSVTPLTRQIVIEWTWSTNDHWGNPVTPTAFIVERKIGSNAYEVLSYAESPAGGPNYTYTDTLSEADAAGVFALGSQLIYRVRVYWVV